MNKNNNRKNKFLNECNTAMLAKTKISLMETYINVFTAICKSSAHPAAYSERASMPIS